MNEDLEHLRLLAIFHYVVAILAGLFALLPIFYLAIGIAQVTGHLEKSHGGTPMPDLFGWFFIAFGGAMMILGFGFAICVFMAGRSLAHRRHYLFCLVMAGVACMFTPFGTILGILAIIVLVRPSVKELFGQRSSAAA